MKDFDFDKLWIGMILGLATPFITLVLYYKINFSFMTVDEFIKYLKLGDIVTSLISLCILTNLAVFYPFIWKEKYKGAYGVLASTFIWAAVVVFLKFFTGNQ